MKKYNIKVNGVAYDVEVEEVGETPAPARAEAPAVPSAPPAAAPAPAASAGAHSVTAPMPGTIVKANVKAGDAVKKGDVLLVLEAMKMENDITAPADCTIVSVNVTQGASVAAGDTLFTY